MKKVIWIFGEVASGKTTLFKNIMENKENVRELLNIDSDRITMIPEDLSIRESSINYSKLENRAKSIENKIKSFLESDYDVLLLMGKYKDMSEEAHSVIPRIGKGYPELEKRILLLSTEDLSILYERIKQSEWFKSDYVNNLRKYPKEWLNVAMTHFRINLYKYEDYGYEVTEVDTTNGYKIINKEHQKIL